MYVISVAAMGLFLVSTSMEWLFLGFILLMGIYWYYKHIFNFWKRKGVKYVDPVIPFGNWQNLLFLKQSFADFLREIYNVFPDEPYVGLYELTTPALLVRDPELIKQILIKDFSSFHVSIIFIYLLPGMISVLSKNLITLTH